jgi:hypothetical protein
MSLSERLGEYVRACFTGLWVQSFEHDEALAEIGQLCRQEAWRLAVWDIDRGLQTTDAATDAVGSPDPLAAVRALKTLAAPDGTTMLVLTNFHRFLQSAEIVQALSRQITDGKQNRTFVIVLSPLVQIPTELEKLFVVLEHDLPHPDQLEQIARGIATEANELPQGEQLRSVLDAAAGLTRYEAEAAFSLSLVRHGRIQPDTVWELKSQTLKKSGLLSLYRGGERFASLGGLDALKSFCLQTLRRDAQRPAAARPRGVLLLGVPGTGKSAFAKALGAETGRPTLILDVGSLMGSLVGQTEQQTRQALRIVDAMAPCILFCDEIEKALAGVSAGATDSGVSARMFGTLLTWLADHTSDVFVVGTCNDISRLPPEFTRAERFDAVFFLDLPTAEQRSAIWRLYLDQFGLNASQPLPADGDWTGAEIRACCRLVPVARTAQEAVDRLRQWAAGRCLSAEQPGLFRADSATAPKTRRKLSRDPSQN